MPSGMPTLQNAKYIIFLNMSECETRVKTFKILRFLNAFCRKMKCILPQNGLRFAAKWNAFCRKMEIVLPQNAKRLGTTKRRFGPKWNAFWPKIERVLAQNGACFGPKWSAFWPKMENAYPIDALHLCDMTSLKP